MPIFSYFIKHKHKCNRFPAGFTIIEIVTAIFILIVGIGTVSGLITHTLSSISMTENKLIAAYLAQEGIELARNIRDNNIINGNDIFQGFRSGSSEASYDEQSLLVPYDDGKIYFSSSTGYTDDSSMQETKFTREIIITIGQNLKVEVDIAFKKKGQTYHFPRVVEILTDQQ